MFQQIKAASMCLNFAKHTSTFGTGSEPVRLRFWGKMTGPKKGTGLWNLAIPVQDHDLSYLCTYRAIALHSCRPHEAEAAIRAILFLVASSATCIGEEEEVTH